MHLPLFSGFITKDHQTCGRQFKMVLGSFLIEVLSNDNVLISVYLNLNTIDANSGLLFLL